MAIQIKHLFDILKHLFSFCLVGDKTFTFELLFPNKSDRARLALLEAAVENFAEKGYEATTVREIAEAAGQNVASISYYFKSKKGLYQALIRTVIQELHRRLGTSFAAIREQHGNENLTPSEAVRLIQLFLRTVYMQVISQPSTLPLSRLIVREQMNPTDSFDIIYKESVQVLHEALSHFVALVLEKDPRDPEVIIRTHSILGQVFFFIVARATILRRMGWKSLDNQNAQLVADILAENVESMLFGLKSKTRTTNDSSK